MICEKSLIFATTMITLAHNWYQIGKIVTIEVYVKNLALEQTSVKMADPAKLIISIGGSAYDFELAAAMELLKFEIT